MAPLKCLRSTATKLRFYLLIYPILITPIIYLLFAYFECALISVNNQSKQKENNTEESLN